MAGFTSLTKAFKKGQIEMHLLSASGSLPMYAVELADGEIAAETGTWEEDVLTFKQAANGEGIALPPTGMPEDAKMFPCMMTIRNGQSPDAERFRKARGLDLKEAQRNIKTFKKAKLSNEDISVIGAASCIVDFKNIPDGADGEVKYLKYSEDAAIKFLKENEQILDQILEVMSDKKKFETSTQLGKKTL